MGLVPAKKIWAVSWGSCAVSPGCAPNWPASCRALAIWSSLVPESSHQRQHLEISILCICQPTHILNILLPSLSASQAAGHIIKTLRHACQSPHPPAHRSPGRCAVNVSGFLPFFGPDIPTVQARLSGITGVRPQTNHAVVFPQSSPRTRPRDGVAAMPHHLVRNPPSDHCPSTRDC
jgi:hypothetical protein